MPKAKALANIDMLGDAIAAYPYTPKPAAEWRPQAACRDFTPQERDDLFFPERGGSTVAGKLVCAGCPVRLDCVYAHSAEKFGVFGGLGERQRRALRAHIKAQGGEVPNLGTLSWPADLAL